MVHSAKALLHTTQTTMNAIRHIRELNKRELENGMQVLLPLCVIVWLTLRSSPEASWHADYRDTAYIYIGGLPFELSEGDVISIFSQYGEPSYVNLIRDKETGKSRGFAFLKYEDQRSTDLAVDNLGGAVIMGRTLKVDHTRYKKKDDEPDDGVHLNREQEESEEGGGESRRNRQRSSESESEKERPMLKEERELAKLIQEHDEDDPMKAFLIQEKKKEVALALARLEGRQPGKSHKQRHHHHRSRNQKEGRVKEEPFEKSRRRKEDRERSRPNSTDNSPAPAPNRSRRRGNDSDSRTVQESDHKPRTRSPRGKSRDRGDRRRDGERPS